MPTCPFVITLDAAQVPLPHLLALTLQLLCLAP